MNESCGGCRHLLQGGDGSNGCTKFGDPIYPQYARQLEDDPKPLYEDCYEAIMNEKALQSISRANARRFSKGTGSGSGDSVTTRRTSGVRLGDETGMHNANVNTEGPPRQDAASLPPDWTKPTAAEAIGEYNSKKKRGGRLRMRHHGKECTC